MVVKRPPRKTIFISRLSSTTTAIDIVKYISSKSAIPFSSINCIKFNFNEPREIASFKLFTPDVYFNLLLSADFWPGGTLVHEYVPRARPASSTKTSVPAAVTSHSKND